MIQVIYGKRGSGKSKRLVDTANAEVNEAKGHIVYMDDNSRCIYDLRHEIRFVNCCDYRIDSADKLYGFITGMMSQDYDISSIYIDSIKHIMEKSMDKLETFFRDLDAITAQYGIRVIMVISGNDDEMPHFLKQYIQ